MPRKLKTIFFILLVSAIVFCVPQAIMAESFYIQENPNMENSGDFMVFPVKNEITIAPGASITRNIFITNRLGREATFSIGIEDLSPAADPKGSFDLKKAGSSDYSLKEYLSPELVQFSLLHGQKMSLPVVIDIPEGIDAGGLYGAVTVSALGENAKGEGVVSAIASLFFVRIEGNSVESGIVKDFSAHSFGGGFFSRPESFAIEFENTGNVHLTPQGNLEIKNIFGSRLDNIFVGPWVVLPQSSRIGNIKWSSDRFLFGRYTANIFIRDETPATMGSHTLVFWVVPREFWYLLALIVIFVGWILLAKKSRRVDQAQKKTSKEWGQKKKGSIFAATVLVLVLSSFGAGVKAAVSESSSYQLERDAVDSGGLMSSSTSYIMESTAGDVGTGSSSSASYQLMAGFQQANGGAVSISDPSSVDLGTLARRSGGTISSVATWTVTTENSTGYSLFLKSATSPSMQGTSENFSDYTPVVAGTPDFEWSPTSGNAEFGFTPEGSDIIQKYKDNGVSCNTGSGDTGERCWNGLSTTNEKIAQSDSANSPSGTETDVRFAVYFDTGSSVSTGVFSASITATAIPN